MDMKIPRIEISLADHIRKFYFILCNSRVWTKTWASACWKQFQHFLVAWCLRSSIKALSFTIDYISKIYFFSFESSIDESTFCIICGFIRDSSWMTIAFIKKTDTKSAQTRVEHKFMERQNITQADLKLKLRQIQDVCKRNHTSINFK